MLARLKKSVILSENKFQIYERRTSWNFINIRLLDDILVYLGIIFMFKVKSRQAADDSDSDAGNKR